VGRHNAGANTICDGYPDRDSYSYANGQSDSNCYIVAAAIAHAYTYINANPMLGEVYTDAPTSPDPGTASVTSAYEKETHCSVGVLQSACFNCTFC
jgi:hypothetical protein